MGYEDGVLGVVVVCYQRACGSALTPPNFSSSADKAKGIFFSRTSGRGLWSCGAGLKALPTRCFIQCPATVIIVQGTVEQVQVVLNHV